MLSQLRRMSSFFNTFIYICYSTHSTRFPVKEKSPTRCWLDSVPSSWFPLETFPPIGPITKRVQSHSLLENKVNIIFHCSVCHPQIHATWGRNNFSFFLFNIRSKVHIIIMTWFHQHCVYISIQFIYVYCLLSLVWPVIVCSPIRCIAPVSRTSESRLYGSLNKICINE